MIVPDAFIADLLATLRFGPAVVRRLLFVHDPILRRGYDNKPSKQPRFREKYQHSL